MSASHSLSTRRKLFEPRRSIGARQARPSDGRWSSVHVADELSPSRRYLLVGSSSKDEPFADIDRIEIIELHGARSLEIVPVPAGADVRATWEENRVKLTWAGGAHSVPLPSAGTPRVDDPEWRPFSE